MKKIILLSSLLYSLSNAAIVSTMSDPLSVAITEINGQVSDTIEDFSNGINDVKEKAILAKNKFEQRKANIIELNKDNKNIENLLLKMSFVYEVLKDIESRRGRNENIIKTSNEVIKHDK